MTGRGDYLHAMSQLSDAQIDSLLAGVPPTDDLAPVAAFFASAKDATRPPVNTAVEDRHLAAIVDAVRRGPDPDAVAPPRRRRRRRAAKIAAVGIALALSTGGLAAAQVLPAPLQDAISSVAERVGVHIAPAAHAPDARDSEGPERPVKTAKPTDGPDHDNGRGNDKAEKAKHTPNGPPDGVGNAPASPPRGGREDTTPDVPGKGNPQNDRPKHENNAGGNGRGQGGDNDPSRDDKPAHDDKPGNGKPN